MREMPISYDGMPKPVSKDEPEVNEDELMGYIMRKTSDRSLTFEDVEAVLAAEEDYLKEKGFMDTE